MKPETKASIPEAPLVSIIIPTYQSSKTLTRCLLSIRNQTYARIETIVVDGGSADNTVYLAKEMGCNVFVLEGIERSPSINYGIRMAKGEFVYRVDSDVILNPELVEQAVHTCKDLGYDAVSVFWSPDSSISFWAKVRKLEKDCYKHDLAHTGARFFRKEVIEALGGFNEALIAGEDYDLINRLLSHNYRVRTIEAEEIHIGEPTCIGDVAKKQFYYGKSLRLFLRSNGVEGAIQVSPLRIALISNWRSFARKPTLMIGFFIYEIVSYSSGVLGFLAGHLSSIERRASR